MSLMNPMKRFALDESALETIEWAVVGGIVTTVGTAIWIAISGDIVRALGDLSGVTSAIP